MRNTKRTDKPLKLSDDAGMYLLVQPTGGKLWRMKYRVDGKEKLPALGAHPDVGLDEARTPVFQKAAFQYADFSRRLAICQTVDLASV